MKQQGEADYVTFLNTVKSKMRETVRPYDPNLEGYWIHYDI